MIKRMARLSLTFFLSFVIAFAPIYANAVLPLLGVAASTGGRILVGQTVKKVAPSLLKRGAATAIGMCKGNIRSNLCVALGVWGADKIYGALTDEEIKTETTINNDNSVEINYYRQDECTRFELYITNYEMPYHGYVANLPTQIKSTAAYNSNILSSINSGRPELDYHSSVDDNFAGDTEKAENYILELSRQNHVAFSTTEFKRVGSTAVSWHSYGARGMYEGRKYYNGLVIGQPCQKEYVSPETINTIIQNTLTENEYNNLVKNVYNYDYSQHPNITINNDTSSFTPSVDLDVTGPDFNTDIKTAPIDFEVSPELAIKIGNDNINMDNINDDNCTKNDEGAYDTCDAIDTSDPVDPPPVDDPSPDPPADDPPPDPEPDPECPTDYTYQPDTELCVLDEQPAEPQPTACSTNGLTQKFCDWMDWTQEEPAIPADTEVEVVDTSKDIQLDENRYQFDNSCPDDSVININVGNSSKTLLYKYGHHCEFLAKMAPFNKGAAYIYAVFILTGIRSRAGDNG